MLIIDLTDFENPKNIEYNISGVGELGEGDAAGDCADSEERKNSRWEYEGLLYSRTESIQILHHGRDMLFIEITSSLVDTIRLDLDRRYSTSMWILSVNDFKV